MSVARLLSRVHPPFCPYCRRSPGLDCPDAGVGKREQRAREKQEWRREAELLSSLPDAARPA